MNNGQSSASNFLDLIRNSTSAAAVGPRRLGFGLGLCLCLGINNEIDFQSFIIIFIIYLVIYISLNIFINIRHYDPFGDRVGATFPANT
jgi:1,4-dihydroxy-2-naphthoate octaprenyltransferase